MSEYTLCFDPVIGPYGYHDPGAAIFERSELVFATEEERYTREKHASNTFPEHAIRACLDHVGIELPELEQITIPYDPDLVSKRLTTDLRKTIGADTHLAMRAWNVVDRLKHHLGARIVPDVQVKDRLRQIGTPLPPIRHREHHRCHAASAFHPTDFDEAVVLTIDGRGEYDSTVVWYANQDGLERIRTYYYPNSLGHFFGAVTEYLGYRAFNGEGKVMGLAPYGEENREIERIFRDAADFGIDYDVTGLLSNGNDTDWRRLADLFDEPKREDEEEFNRFHKDLAYTAQALLEETICAIVGEYVDRFETGNVGLAGGVALNCKANTRVMEMDCVDDIFVQPVANDAGLALGAGWLETDPTEVEPMATVYFGYEPVESEVGELLETNKIRFDRIDDVEQYIAGRLADGSLVGWVQGRLEMGPRALGNRSILADPRTEESRDRVNEYVKHRESWRPFAPSMLEEAADEYLVNAEPAPFMIKTFDTIPEKREEMAAVVHPADMTTRPQTVREEQNPRYHRLISEFEEITGVPVVLNTSFNDHGEPIVRTADEALRDFYGMGLDILVIGNYVVEK